MSNSRLLRRTGCQYVGYSYYSENLNWAAWNLLLGCEGCGLDIAGLDNAGEHKYQYNAPSTIATDYHHIGGLNNGGKMKICFTFEVTE